MPTTHALRDSCRMNYKWHSMKTKVFYYVRKSSDVGGPASSLSYNQAAH